MKRMKNLLVIVFLAVAVLAGWKTGSCELANMELQEDMLDLSSQNGGYSKYPTVRSEQDFRDAVIRKAQDHDIQLEPSEVTVRRADSGSNMYLAADYTVPVDVLGYSFTLHFTPNSTSRKVF